jgi:hypothetical protein
VISDQAGKLRRVCELQQAAGVPKLDMRQLQVLQAAQGQPLCGLAAVIQAETAQLLANLAAVFALQLYAELPQLKPL